MASSSWVKTVLHERGTRCVKVTSRVLRVINLTALDSLDVEILVRERA
jgi:hypothetical protein